MKKVISILTIAILAITMLVACSENNANTTDNQPNDVATSLTGEISVVSRENGSGTRGAFIELIGVEVKDENGNKQDKTTDEAIIANKTDVMLSNITGDKNAIGYISMGSLNDGVKALSIDGTASNVENIKNGTYKVSRPFVIATKTDSSTLSELAKDFMDYILSKEGQEIVVKGGYIAVSESATAFSGGTASGKITVAGSSSVTPIMEKLKEAYLVINSNADIEILMSDSTSGIKAATDGTASIGMSSRELKESELAELTQTNIAIDGIVIIVNKENALDNLTKEQVRQIFTGEATYWSEVQ